MFLLFSYIIFFTILFGVHSTEKLRTDPDRYFTNSKITSGLNGFKHYGGPMRRYDCCLSCISNSAKLNRILRELRSSAPPRDCSDLPRTWRSGVYLIRPGLDRPQPAYCEMDKHGHGWILIQHRADIRPRLNFYRGWDDYKWGFGDLHGEFWWGLEHLWLVTSMLDRTYELRIDMQDFRGNTRFAKYSGFKVASEADGYRLTVTNYAGNAGDSFTHHSGAQFSTKDRDHDAYRPSSCAKRYKGAWWYKACHSSNLNGQYLAGYHKSYADGVNWKHWSARNVRNGRNGYHYSLKDVKMLIRSTGRYMANVINSPKAPITNLKGTKNVV